MSLATSAGIKTEIYAFKTGARDCSNDQMIFLHCLLLMPYDNGEFSTEADHFLRLKLIILSSRIGSVVYDLL